MDTDSKGFLRREVVNRLSRRPDMGPTLLETEPLRVTKDKKPGILEEIEMSFDAPVDKYNDADCQLVVEPLKAGRLDKQVMENKSNEIKIVTASTT